MVECGGLENRFTCNPGNEGSNPSSSARKVAAPRQGRVCCYGKEGFEPMRWNAVAAARKLGGQLSALSTIYLYNTLISGEFRRNTL